MAGKKNKKEELEKIKRFLEKHKSGVSSAEIQAAVHIERRTLLRRLQELGAQGSVRSSGQTRTIRYHLVEQKDEPQIGEQANAPLIPLSAKGEKINALVSQPIQRRKPVAYNLNFLRDYRPNVDFYLTNTDLKKLAELGKTAKRAEPAGTYARQILHRLLIDLSWNSSRLEGNTYSLLDTERLISLGEEADNKSAIEAQMILNHKDAIEFIIQSAEDIRFNRYTILNLHGMLSNNLLANRAASGRLRQIAVGVGQTVYMPLEIPQQIEEMFELFLAKADEIQNPFEQAFFAMAHLPYLQPFEDVNKRVSRLAANIPLTKNNLAPLSFTDVPKDVYTKGLLGIYELNKIELLKDVFMWAYERSAAQYAVIRQTLGEPDPFHLKYRVEIKEAIAEIISLALSKKEAAKSIKLKAENIPEKNRHKFIEAVETELLSLHEGNFARYWVKPSEFKKWKEVWDEGLNGLG